MQFTFLIADHRSWEQWEVVWSKKLELRLLFDLSEMPISGVDVLIFQNDKLHSFCFTLPKASPKWRSPWMGKGMWITYSFVLCMVQGPGNNTHFHASITVLCEPTVVRLLTWDHPRRRKFSPTFLAILGKGQIFSTVPF